jgi:PASTA domain
MKLKYFFHISPLLLALALAAATAQTPPCSALSPDEALFARVTGACRDSAPIVDQRSKGAAIVEKGSRAGKTAGRGIRQGDLPRRAAPTSEGLLQVPNVTGIPFDTAQVRLARFNVEKREQYSPAPVGRVIEQAPNASTHIAAGSAIVLTVSAGPAVAETFEMPNVVDRTDAAAGDALAEFKVQRVPVPSAAPIGMVVAQHPDPVALRGLIIGAATLLALVIGGAIRRWRRARAIEPQVGSADTSPAPAASAVTADDFRFAAHLDAGEVRVELAGPANLQETSDEVSSVQHA